MTKQVLKHFVKEYANGVWKLVLFVLLLIGFLAGVAVVWVVLFLPSITGAYVEHGIPPLEGIIAGKYNHPEYTIGGEWLGITIVWWFLLSVGVHAAIQTRKEYHE